MKKPLAALALAAASVAALAVPAGAAVPKRPASQTVPCNDGSGKAAQIWQRPGELAAKNPCSTWLVLGYGTRYASGAPANAYALAAGAHFNWGKKQHPPVVTSWVLLSSEGCGATNVQEIHSYKDVRPAPCN